jgi:hypothetical protein
MPQGGEGVGRQVRVLLGCPDNTMELLPTDHIIALVQVAHPQHQQPRPHHQHHHCHQTQPLPNIHYFCIKVQQLN